MIDEVALMRWLTVLKDRVETLPVLSTEQIVTGELDPDLIPPIPWDRVLKAGSSLGDLETRSASDLSSGTLAAARMPALTGDVSSVAGTVATTLATVTTDVGSFGSGTAIPILTINAKGLVIAATEQPIHTGALTRVNDTNVTATLGGTPATALLEDVSITLGWIGQLALSRGGTNANLTAVNGGLVYSTATALAITAAGTSGQIVKSVGAGTPTWNTPAALTRVDDTNVTLTLGGSASTALVNAASLTLGWTGLLGLARGGTAADLSATGGAKNYLKQASVGAAVTVGTIPASDIVSGAALTKTDDTNVTLTLGGTPTAALLAATSLTLGWAGTLGVTRGGTGTGTAFTAGSVVFAGASGVYAQDNSKFFWDDSNDYLGLGMASPTAPIELAVAVLPSQDAGVNNYCEIFRSTFNAAHYFNLRDARSNGSVVNSGGITFTSPANGGGSREAAAILYHTTTSGAAAGKVRGYLTLGTNDGTATYANATPFVIAYTGDIAMGPISSVSAATGALLVVKASTGTVGVGVLAPTEFVEMAKGANAAVRYQFRNTTTGTAARSIVSVHADDTSGAAVDIAAYSSSFSTSGFTIPSSVSIAASAAATAGLSLATAVGGAPIMFWINSSEVARFGPNGNLLMGTTTSPGTGTAGLVFADGTAFASMGSNTAGLYAEDVGGTVRMFAIDEAGVTGAIVMASGALTSGKIPVATANGRLTDLTASSAYTPTNVTTDRSYDANATTLDEIADVVGTMIADLQAKGILG